MGKNYTIDVRDDAIGVCAVQGFKAGAAAADIRNKNDFERLDTAVVVSDVLATAAGVFTTNDVKAAPVLTDISNLERSTKVRAIVANSGNANACTGDRGMDDARNTCKYLAEKLGVEQQQILVCSTGRIGEFMPMQKLQNGIDAALGGLAGTEDASGGFARHHDFRHPPEDGGSQCRIPRQKTQNSGNGEGSGND